jgi:hypothetical protein
MGCLIRRTRFHWECWDWFSKLHGDVGEGRTRRSKKKYCNLLSKADLWG